MQPRWLPTSPQRSGPPQSQSARRAPPAQSSWCPESHTNRLFSDTSCGQRGSRKTHASRAAVRHTAGASHVASTLIGYPALHSSRRPSEAQARVPGDDEAHAPGSGSMLHTANGVPDCSPSLQNPSPQSVLTQCKGMVEFEHWASVFSMQMDWPTAHSSPQPEPRSPAAKTAKHVLRKSSGLIRRPFPGRWRSRPASGNRLPTTPRPRWCRSIPILHFAKRRRRSQAVRGRSSRRSAR